MLQTIEELRVSAQEILSPRSVSAQLDAEVLLRTALNCDSAYLIAHAEEQVDAKHHDRFMELLARREQGEPISYILGQQEFWSLSLKITPATLIPRPETECLVEQALPFVWSDRESLVFDLGTGSGAIAVALASERPQARIIAVDLCPKALAVAAQNANSLGLDNIEFRHGNWFSPTQDLQADLIVANPPYIPDNDPHLFRGNVAHEPALALKGGSNGLDSIETIAAGGIYHLKPEGHLFLEHGFDQASAVQAYLERNGYINISTIKDYSGLDRVTHGQTNQVTP